MNSFTSYFLSLKAKSKSPTILNSSTKKALRPFEYPPLIDSQKEIRLLTLLPGRFNSELRMSLKTASFTENTVPRFEALSYTWGSTENPVDILIKNTKNIFNDSSFCTLTVTRNLAEALPFLRHENRSRVLWIDAICVNQQDLNERSSQVKRMADIYSKATKVVVWVGLESDDSPIAMDCMREIAANVVLHRGQHQMTTSADERWREGGRSLPFSTAQMLAISNFIHRPWFERLWIWQEVSLASSAAVVCGLRMIPWGYFCTFCFWLSKKSLDYHVFIAFNADKRLQIVLDLCHGKNASFSILCQRTRNSKCTDARDRIYALLSITHPSDNPRIEPDYNKSNAEIFQEFVLKHIDHTHSLQLLATVSRIDEKTSDMPTWVPNWAVPAPTTLLYAIRVSSNSMAATVQEGNILHVMGISIGIVEDVQRIGITETMHKLGVRNGLVEAISKWQLKAELVQGSQELRALCRIVCCSASSETYEAPFNGSLSMKRYEEILYNMIHRSPITRSTPISPDEGIFLTGVGHTCTNRSLFMTKKGNIGIGPQAMKKGDIVAIFLGCNSAMILRPNGNDQNLDLQYRLVGEAICDGFLWGEALLGPFPEGFEVVYRPDNLSPAYINRNHGIMLTEDPRLKYVPLPSGWSRKGQCHAHTCFVNEKTRKEMHGHDPRMTAGALQERGKMISESLTFFATIKAVGQVEEAIHTGLDFHYGDTPHQSSTAALIDSSKYCLLCKNILETLRVMGSENGSLILDLNITDFSISHRTLPYEFPGYYGMENSFIKFLNFKVDGEITEISHIKILVILNQEKVHISNRAIWTGTSPMQFDKRLVVIRQWMDSCQSHSDCRPHADILPTRLVDVGIEDEQEPPKLIYTSKLAEARLVYTTLSHCWGSKDYPPLRTTRTSEKIYLSGIPPDSLPRTFKDAIIITRKLGIRYIWIDSLCIVQDDPKDWEREASRMSSVYQGGSFTIAATDSTDSRGGCYLESPKLTLQIKYNPNQPEALVKLVPGNFEDKIQESALNERGWVLQELFLSKRILYCTKDQFYWQCRECITSEDGHYKSQNLICIRQQRGRSWGKVLKKYYNHEEMWWDCVFDFSLRKLSFKEDRVAAIAGITRWYQNMTSKTPALGLWKEELAIDLCWHVGGETLSYKPLVGRVRPIPSRIANVPSWTWLSLDCEIYRPFHLTSVTTTKISILELDIQWTGEPLTSTITSATKLILYGHVKVLKFEVWSKLGAIMRTWILVGQERDAPFIACFLDEDHKIIDSEAVLEKPCVLLTHDGGCGTFLILEQVPMIEPSNVFRRIGAGQYQGYCEDKSIFHEVKPMILSLV